MGVLRARTEGIEAMVDERAKYNETDHSGERYRLFCDMQRQRDEALEHIRYAVEHDDLVKLRAFLLACGVRANMLGWDDK